MRELRVYFCKIKERHYDNASTLKGKVYIGLALFECLAHLRIIRHVMFDALGCLGFFQLEYGFIFNIKNKLGW